MVRRGIYIVAYDIVNDKRRRDIVTLIQANGGIRKNKSVFELILTIDKYRKMKETLLNIIVKNKDVVLMYPICKKCYAKSITVGSEPVKPSVIVV